LPSEHRCSTLRVKARSGPWYWPQFEAKLLLPGPFKGLLELKREGRPYTLQRFRAWGTIKARTLGAGPIGVPVYVVFMSASYMGRSGVEVELARWRGSSPEAELTVDRHLDVYREWRGPGLQGLRVTGRTSWECDVELSASICFELTWVG
jgi:hypothetical protein